MKMYLGVVAGSFLVLQNLVLENGIIESQSQSHGVAGGQRTRKLRRSLVGSFSFLGNRLPLFSRGDFSRISMVIPLPVCREI